MNKMSFLDCVDIVGSSVKEYDGIRKYVSTGALNCDHIEADAVEEYSFSEKPSRANLEVDEGSLLFAKMQGTQKTLVIDKENQHNIYSTGFAAVKPKNNIISARCLYHLVTSDDFLKQKDLNCSGATQKAITNEGLKKIAVSIPDLCDQAKIAGILDQVDELIKMLHRNSSLLDDIVKSRFIELFGDPEKNSKNWPVYQLDELCDVGSSKRIYQEEQTLEGVPFWRISDLVNKMDIGYANSGLYISQEKYDELEEKGQVPVVGDILVTSRGTLGRCYIISETDKFYFQDGMISWLSKYKHGITPLYIKHLFMTSGLIRQINGMQAGSTVAYLSIAMLKKLDIMLPDPGVQLQFEEFVKQVDKSKHCVKNDLLRCLQKQVLSKSYRR